ncbi:MAG: hypothetical protein J6K03_00110 [Oscillospiraceae bacterium]|nr:hypothetical protein [Oscillospiraceae bacterium]
MEHWKLTQWCTYAVSKIKYTPDRRAVYDELRQHLDDRCESFLERGMSKDEAAAKTVEVMGDPKELAPQLAAIHRPFWGYACSIIKWASILVLTAAFLVGLWNYLSPYLRSSYYSRYSSPSYSSGNPYTGEGDAFFGKTQTVRLTSDQSFTDSGYTVTMTDLTVWTAPDWDFARCHFLLEITALMPWTDGPMFTDTLRVRDSNGTEYLCYLDQSDFDKGKQLVIEKYHTGPLQWLCDITFHMRGEPVSWIELYYDRDGREHVIRIELPGGDSA